MYEKDLIVSSRPEVVSEVELQQKYKIFPRNSVLTPELDYFHLKHKKHKHEWENMSHTHTHTYTNKHV